MRSIGLTSSSSCRTARRQNEATAARLRLRLRVDAGLPGDLAKEHPTGATVSPGISPSWQPAKAVL
jgi:hypothetical protein